MPWPAAAGIPPSYTTEGSKTTFYLNTNKLNFTQAETACTAFGGHLAAFVDKEEQVGLAQAAACTDDLLCAGTGHLGRQTE